MIENLTKLRNELTDLIYSTKNDVLISKYIEVMNLEFNQFKRESSSMLKLLEASRDYILWNK